MVPCVVRGATRFFAQFAAASLASVLVWPAVAAPESCTIASEQGLSQFPVAHLDPAARCQLGHIVNDFSTAGTLGPVQTPIPLSLYTYLLDRPPLMASLLDRLGLGAYQFAAREPNQFWVNDGDGTQGLLSLVYRDDTSRIYHIDGQHEGHVFPLVRAKAAVFMKIQPATTPEGYPAVQSMLMSYTRLDSSLVAGLVRILRPLVNDAVTRKLSRGFEATNLLGLAIAQNPDRVAQQAALVPWLNVNDLQTLIGLLYTVPQRASASPPGMVAP
jgi:hypothetical protein